LHFQIETKKKQKQKNLKPEPTEEEVDTDGWHTERHPRSKTETGFYIVTHDWI
jgi:hypothetical protein